MIILPAMDIKDGKCVRLYQGEFSTTQVVSDSPINTAKDMEKQGAEYLHMVDLDGALKGEVVNFNIICDIIKNANIPVQLGGGIRNIKTIETLINNGLGRVILGTAALNNPSLVKEAVRLFNDKIAVGIDAKDGYVSVEGWTNTSKTKYIEFGKRMESIGIKTIIFTDISKDGMLLGPNFEATFELNEKVSCDIIASGGIKGIEDIKILKKMNIYGTIIGKAIYSGNIDLSEAIRVAAGRGDINAY